MPTDTLPDAHHHVPARGGLVRVEAYRSPGGHLRLRGLADPDEVATHRAVIAAAVERLTTEADRSRSATPTDAPSSRSSTSGSTRRDRDLHPGVAVRRVAASCSGWRACGSITTRRCSRSPAAATPRGTRTRVLAARRARCLTMWMPLVDITPRHGGLCFASGSHTEGPLSDIDISDASEEHFDGLVARRGLVVDEPVAMRPATHLPRGVDGAPGPAQRLGRDARGHDRHLVRRRAGGPRPANPAQAGDLAAWLPGLEPGHVAASPPNPALPR